MTETNFQPIFDYIDQAIEPLKEGLREIVREELRPINTRLTNLVGEVKKFNEEMTVSNFRTSRLEKWAKPVGDKVGIPLDL